MEPAARSPEGIELPLQALDKACLAASDAAAGLSNAPTWRLELEGVLPAAALRRALAGLIVACPSIAATVVPKDGPPARARGWAYRLPEPAAGPDDVPDALLDALWTLHPAATWETLDGRPALDGGAAGRPAATPPPVERTDDDALGQRICDRFLDLTAGPGLRLDLRPRPGGATLWLQQHHALADGRAFIALLERLFALLDPCLRGEAIPAELLRPMTRQPELAALRVGPWRRRLWTLRGALVYLRGAIAAAFAPLDALAQNVGADYRGSNRTLHLPIPADRLRALRARSEAAGANLHAGLLAAWTRANAALSAERGQPVRRVMLTSIVDLRPRAAAGEVAFESFANHLGWTLPIADLERAPDAGRLAASLHRQMRRQLAADEPWQRALFERLGVLALPLAALRKALSAPPRAVVQLNVSNVLALPIPTLRAGEVEVRKVRITTPVAPRYGALLTLTRYGDEACCNVNVKASVMDNEAAERLVALFAEELGLAPDA